MKKYYIAIGLLMFSSGVGAEDKDLALVPVNYLSDVDLDLNVHHVDDHSRPIWEMDAISTAKIGDEVSFSFEASKSGYVSLWNIGTSGKVYRFFPNRYNNNMYVKAGEHYTLAGKDASYAIKINEPEGMENVYMLWTQNERDQPVQLNKYDLLADATDSNYKTKDLTPVTHVSPKLWATKKVVFEVTYDGKPRIIDLVEKSIGLKVSDIKGDVYLLAMGANVGQLTKANEDTSRFAKVIKSILPHEKLHPIVKLDARVNDFMQAMKEIQKKAKPDDIVIIFFSGHGSTTPDKNGDEDDGVDEVFVMADVKDVKNPNIEDVLVDDDFAREVNKINTNNIITIIDACHSGGMAKGGLESIVGRDKFFIGGMLGRVAPALIDWFTGGADNAKGVIIYAASADNKAIETTVGGAMTNALVEEMSNVKNNGKNWYEIIKKAEGLTYSRVNIKPGMKGDISLLKNITLISVN